MTEKLNDRIDWIQKLIEVMERLRGPGGCPWDRKQTHQSLKKYLVEESAELMDAIDDEDIPGIQEELGDLLMHIVFHSVIAGENDHFDFNQVAQVSAEKMLRRHPHVFGDESVETPEEVVGLWEEIKRREKGERKGEHSVMDGIPRNLSALLRARKAQKKAAEYGFDWEKQEQIIDKIQEELDEIREAVREGDGQAIDEEIGDLLFAVVNLSRFRNGPSSEELLNNTIMKFIYRFKYIESELAKQGKSLMESSIDEMEALWQAAKKH